MTQPSQMAHAHESDPLVRARREKLARWREELGVEPYGRRVDGLLSLAEARALFDQSAHEAYAANHEDDRRPRALVAGRCVQHRLMGKLVFMLLRDHSGDLQVSVSKSDLDAAGFKLASKLDYGDIVVAGGRVGMTQKGEVCVWADRFEVHCKSLVPPPEKFHGLTDPELRYRQRYVDMFANPETLQTLTTRSVLVSQIRRFMESRGFLEVETPMMQPIAGGAAARPFTTHHNALNMPLYMRIAPELYLKRLLVGGMPRVYEINRNFRNEGIDRQHNPEFTMMEVYEAFGDYETMRELTESLIHELAQSTQKLSREPQAVGLSLPFGDRMIDYSRPFAKVTYGELFEKALGFSMFDRDQVRAKAKQDHIENADRLDHWLLASALFDRHAEHTIDPSKPTFVTDFPSAISPLTRPHENNPELSYRWELFIAGMELANSYTELNDPDVQLAKFTEQLAGADEEVQTFRTLDEDFIHALRVGMPPAGGLGVGIDRIIMLMTNSTTIRDVILFPLMKPIGDATE
ncbi:MAG TPA: lysine--tRNA ligase [Phycisphaerales bacterium]|nr:lysine--tRNA ligase [Phycisphaerales bacterium]HRQ75906.1 lysine--tRNA ligase [Phycisphaerales bacterium]